MANVRQLDAHLRDGKLRQAMREAEAAKAVTAPKSSTAPTVAAIRGSSGTAAVLIQTRPCGCTGTTQHHPAPRAPHRGCRGAAPVSKKPTSAGADQNPKPAHANARANARTNISRPPPVPTPPAPIPFEQFLRPRPGPAPAPANPTPIQACTVQLFPTPFPKPLPLPISQLDPSLPVPIVIDGLERYSYKSPPLTKDLGTPGGRIGGTAIIPAGVDITKVSRVMFWMQGEDLSSKDEAFIAALLPVAQTSAAVIIILASEPTQRWSVRDRREQYVKFINDIATYGMGLESGASLRLVRNPYICLAGWSRGASAAIEVSAGITKAKLKTGLTVSSIVAVGPTANTNPQSGVLADPLSVLAVRERLNRVSSIFVTSYADADTRLDAFWYTPAFGGGTASSVHFTADCANHKRLVALTDPELTGCTFPGSNWTSSKPNCGDDDIGRLWLIAASWMIGGAASSKAAWQSLVAQRVAPRSGPGGITVCVQGGGAKSPNPSIEVRDASSAAPVPHLKGIGLDFISGPTLSELAKGVNPTILIENQLSVCKKLPVGARFGGMTNGRTGTVTAIRSGQTVKFTLRIKGPPAFRVSRIRFPVAVVGAASLGYPEKESLEAPANPVIQKIPVCIALGRTVSELKTTIFTIVSSDPAFPIRRCTGQSVSGCGLKPWLRHYGDDFSMQTITVDVPNFSDSEFAVSIMAFAADGVVFALGDPELLP